ncbi:hypothetical protein BpHYR1_003341 [Brachionus plicatilis]|uniref:Uncharacterized protein n=1 Tax=Brachionus plicatilis TaxID=10195 RepID=A0A3M7R8W0_BRAPC|nr:hypothetical protein BpHYR1_003341 [Brachionus plicatilis]
MKPDLANGNLKIEYDDSSNSSACSQASSNLESWIYLENNLKLDEIDNYISKILPPSLLQHSSTYFVSPFLPKKVQQNFLDLFYSKLFLKVHGTLTIRIFQKLCQANLDLNTELIRKS